MPHLFARLAATWFVRLKRKLRCGRHRNLHGCENQRTCQVGARSILRIRTTSRRDGGTIASSKGTSSRDNRCPSSPSIGTENPLHNRRRRTTQRYYPSKDPRA